MVNKLYVSRKELRESEGFYGTMMSVPISTRDIIRQKELKNVLNLNGVSLKTLQLCFIRVNYKRK
jgi:hypothetical protein